MIVALESSIFTLVHPLLLALNFLDFVNYDELPFKR